MLKLVFTMKIIRKFPTFPTASDFRRYSIRSKFQEFLIIGLEHISRDKLLDNPKITDYTGADLATAQAITITGTNEAGGVITVTPDNIVLQLGTVLGSTQTVVLLDLFANADGGSDFDVTLTTDILPNQVA